MHGQTSIKEILFYVSSHFHFMIQNFKSQVAFTHQVFARKCQHIFVAISSVKAHCQPTSNRWDSVCFRNMECIFCVIFYIDDNRENQIQLMTKLFFSTDLPIFSSLILNFVSFPFSIHMRAIPIDCKQMVIT